MNRNDLYIKSNFVMTCKKYPQNLHTPRNIQFSETPKKYWNSKFWTQKNTQAYVRMEISEYPPHGGQTDRQT